MNTFKKQIKDARVNLDRLAGLSSAMCHEPLVVMAQIKIQSAKWSLRLLLQQLDEPLIFRSHYASVEAIEPDTDLAPAMTTNLIALYPTLNAIDKVSLLRKQTYEAYIALDGINELLKDYTPLVNTTMAKRYMELAILQLIEAYELFNLEMRALKSR